jgi:hypothetical protein
MNCRVLPRLLSLLAVLPAVAAEPVPSPGEIPRLISSRLVFTDGRLSGPVSQAEIDGMGQRTLKLSGGHSYDFLMKEDQVFETRTLAEYRDAIQGGAEVHGGYALACAVRFCEGWSTWSFLRQAKPARVSHFGKGWLGTLSVELVGWYGSDEMKQREADVKAGKNLLDYQKAGEISALVLKEKSASFDSHRKFKIEWLAAGDFDGDGTEDRLIRVSEWADPGTAFLSESYLVTRKSPSVPCSSLKSFLGKSMLAR